MRQSKTIEIPSTPKIDSLKLEIELDKVRIIDPTFYTKLYLIDGNGEVLNDNFKQNSIKLLDKGASTHYRIAERHSFKTGSKEKYLQILLNSKVLRHRYFEGITKDTIEYLYESILEQDKIYCTYDTFIQGKVTDIDFCKDYYRSKEVFKSMLEKTADMATAKKVQIKRFNRENNLGLQISTREAQNAISKPFIKWYSKLLELQNHSPEFYKEHLQLYFTRNHGQYLSQYKNLRRVEVTVKNRKHLMDITGESDNSFEKVLNLDHEEIIETILRKYIDGQKQFMFKSTLSPVDQTAHQHIHMLMEKGYSIEDLVALNKKLFKNRTERMRQKKRIIKLANLRLETSTEIPLKNQAFIDQLLGRSENP